ncbi:MAG: hypothetical protein ACTS6G_02100 [Candidatus Hodgkinia cicadicola]
MKLRKVQPSTGFTFINGKEESARRKGKDALPRSAVRFVRAPSGAFVLMECVVRKDDMKFDGNLRRRFERTTRRGETINMRRKGARQTVDKSVWRSLLLRYVSLSGDLPSVSSLIFACACSSLRALFPVRGRLIPSS